jgi:8-oxo-dGTP pyrophosphatase MutT (NUDIX family)
MARAPIPSYFFALVIVRHGDRFLLVREIDDGQPWYLPAGRVEPGETIVEAARRETIEEAGIDPRLNGILRIEHTPRKEYTRVRVVFVAEPIGSTEPKRQADEESLGAEWVTLAELESYRLRNPDVGAMIRHVAAGGAIYPLEVLQGEDG